MNTDNNRRLILKLFSSRVYIYSQNFQILAFTGNIPLGFWVPISFSPRLELFNDLSFSSDQGFELFGLFYPDKSIFVKIL